jgi:hypothetical protein
MVFEPGTALRRGDMARAVAKAMGLAPATNWEGRFKDVHSGSGGYGWLGPWIVALVDAGVVNGYDDGTFRPGGALRRDQMATFLAKALDLPMVAPSFDDVKNVGSIHYLAIGAIQRRGIGVGTGARNFDPGGSMRRDQAATLLVRAFDIQRPPPPPEPEPEPEPTTGHEFPDGDGTVDEHGGETTDGFGLGN